jgi:hypothetical protein
MVGKTLPWNGHTSTTIGVGPQAFPDASHLRLVSDLRSLPVGGRRDRAMFQNQTYGGDHQTPIVRRVRLTPGGRPGPFPEQDLERSPGLTLVLLGSILLIALCLAALTGLAFSLVPALHPTRHGLTPSLQENGDIAARPNGHLSLRNVPIACQVAGLLALFLIVAFLVVGFRGKTEAGFGSGSRNLDPSSPEPVRDGYFAERSVPFCQEALHRVRSFRSVSAASLRETVPMGVLREAAITFSVAGEHEAEGARAVSATGQLLRQYLLQE